MNSIMLQAQVALAKYPPDRANILHRDIFWFFLEDDEFVSQTINACNIDLDKFPATKEMESSKATTRHIKQVASDLQTVQINMMQHQHTDLPASKHKKKKSYVKPRPPSNKNDVSDRQPVPSYHNKKIFDSKHVYKNKERCQKCGDSLHAEGFQCPAKNTSVSLVTSMDILLVYVTRRNKLLPSQGNLRPICYKQEQYMPVTNPYAAIQKICLPAMILFAYKCYIRQCGTSMHFAKLLFNHLGLCQF